LAPAGRPKAGWSPPVQCRTLHTIATWPATARRRSPVRRHCPDSASEPRPNPRYGHGREMRIIVVTACVAVVAAGALASTLCLAAASDAATRRATDREAGIRFTLEDRVLTVRILRSAPRRVRRQVLGERVTAACQRYRPVVKVTDRRRWRDGARKRRFRFDRNISRTVAWCLLEHRRGGDIAFVAFGQ
jgi:hypothetical protein